MTGRRRVCAPAPRGHAVRRWIGLAAAAVVAAAVAIIVMEPAASAAGDASPVARGGVAANPAVRYVSAPSGTASATADHGRINLSVTPSDGLAPFGARVTVRGSGYSTKHNLWVAICEDDGAAPRSLTHCLGGRIPESNNSTSWGIVGNAHVSGPASTSWQSHGSFQLQLFVRAASGQNADCVHHPCSVYTRSSDTHDQSQNARVRIRFASTHQSTTASSSSPTVPGTQTLGVEPTTVVPQTIEKSSVAAGAKQTVIFAGFLPGEKVNVTLFSAAIPLPPVTATADGIVTVAFTVPDDLPPGEHLLQVVGQKSRRVGVAPFEVGPAATGTAVSTVTTVTTETAGETTPVTSESTAMTPDSATPQTTASNTPDSTGTTDSSGDGLAGAETGPPSVTGPSSGADVAAPTEAVTTATPSAGDAAAGRLIWLWVALAVIAVLAIAALVVVAVRRRRYGG